jgi:hypothetical protein
MHSVADRVIVTEPYDYGQAGGDDGMQAHRSLMQAYRSLKPRLPDVVYRALRADEAEPTTTSPRPELEMGP